jgi:hypothetical protein
LTLGAGGDTAQGVAIPRLAGKVSGPRKDGRSATGHTRSSIERGYATARARSQTDEHVIGGVRVGRNNPRPRILEDALSSSNGGGTFMTDVDVDSAGTSASAAPRHLWEEPDVIGFDDEGYPRQGLTLVRVRAQHEQLQDTFMSKVGIYGGQKSSG